VTLFTIIFVPARGERDTPEEIEKLQREMPIFTTLVHARNWLIAKKSELAAQGFKPDPGFGRDALVYGDNAYEIVERKIPE